jgi:hypothetical protein
VPPGPNSISTANGERIRVRANVAVRSDQRLQFGRVLWVEPERILLQLEQPLEPNELAEMRVDLSPLPGTALAKGIVLRELPRADAEVPRYLLRLTGVAPDDRLRWQAWLEEKRVGGTLSHVSEIGNSQNPLQSGYTPIAEAERAAALNRMRGKSSSSHPSSHGSNSWLTSDVQESVSGRAAMRDALKSAIRRTTETEPPGRVVASRAVAEGTALPPARPGPTPRAGVPLVQPRASDPTWTSSELKGNTYVEIRWISAEVFSYDVHSQLVALTLSLPASSQPFPTKPPIHVFLRHDPVMIQCTAMPVAQAPDHASYRLDLSASHLAELRRFARALSVDQSLAIERTRRR